MRIVFILTWALNSMACSWIAIAMLSFSRETYAICCRTLTQKKRGNAEPPRYAERTHAERTHQDDGSRLNFDMSQKRYNTTHTFLVWKIDPRLNRHKTNSCCSASQMKLHYVVNFVVHSSRERNHTENTNEDKMMDSELDTFADARKGKLLFFHHHGLTTSRLPQQLDTQPNLP